MAVLSYESEFTSSIPPARLFKAFVLDADNLFPKIAPNAVKSVEIIDGDGGAGTIKKITFGEGYHFNYSKQKIETVDKDNFVYAYSLIEGDALINKLKKISCENKFIAAEGGSIFKSVSKYHTKSDNHDIIEDKIKAGKEKVAHLFKVVEKYLQENPDAYN
nr:major strawberry allergen Fra a 1.05-like [Ziziphus jujuba var. spinosa]